MRGKLVSGGTGKRADHIPYIKPDIPPAVVEAKPGSHPVSNRIQKVLAYSETFGPAFIATGPLHCAGEPNKPMIMCHAGVKRAGNGSGTVRVSTLGGGSRVIKFANGGAEQQDAGAGLTAERCGDATLARVGASTVYRFPDAFIHGSWASTSALDAGIVRVWPR